MAKFIAIFNDMLGDIELNGLLIMTDKEVEHYEELANSITWGFDYALGDGEDELGFSSGEDLLTKIEFREISNDEYKSMKKIFNPSFGIFLDEKFLKQVIGETEDPETSTEDEELDNED